MKILAVILLVLASGHAQAHCIPGECYYEEHRKSWQECFDEKINNRHWSKQIKWDTSGGSEFFINILHKCHFWERVKK